MTLREKIEVMEAFERGEKVEYRRDRLNDMWFTAEFPAWNWKEFEYRIKPKQKQVVVIEKWLCLFDSKIFSVLDIEKSQLSLFCAKFNYKTLKLLDTYEVEL